MSVALISQLELAAVEQFLYLLIGSSLLMDYVGNVARLPEVFYEFSNTLFASVVRDNDLLSGVERRKRSMAAVR